MRFRATVRVTEHIDMDAQVPALIHADHQRARTNRPGQVGMNEAEVLAARRDLAAHVEQLARQRYPDATEILIEEIAELEEQTT